MPTLVRIWARARRSIARQWELDNARPYFYAGPGRSASIAAWKQGYRAELADALDVQYGQVLLDLIKCFEHVALEVLVAEAISMGYSITILRLSISSYLMPRTIRIDGVCSRIVRAMRGIIAGSVYATTELRVLIVRALDRTCKAVPRAPLTAYVDDVSVEASGTERTVTEDLTTATEMIITLFRPLGLLPSTTKNEYTVSSTTLQQELDARMASLRISFRKRVKSLGIGLGAGKRRNVTVARRRLQAFKKRARRFLALNRSGVSVTRVLKTGGTAGMQYGQAVMGVSSSHLLQQRRAAAAACSPETGGKDLDLVLITADGPSKGAKVDPAFAAHLDPLCTWTEALWCKWFSVSSMNRAISAAKTKLAKARRPWAAVRGPAAGVVATAARIDWTFSDACTVTMHDGNVLRLDIESPKAVAAYVREAVARWRWLRVERNHPHLDSGGMGRGAAFEPVLKMIIKNSLDEGWGQPQRAALRSAITRGQWPQARLVATGLATDASCKFCAAAAIEPADDADERDTNVDRPIREDDARARHGDEFHRVFNCKHTWGVVCRHLRHHNAQHIIDGLAEVRAQAAQAARDSASGRPDRVLAWTRALLPSRTGLVPPPSQEGTWEWDIRPDSLPVEGLAYPDASMLDGPTCVMGRFGWGFVIVRNDPFRIVAAAYGAVPSWITSMLAAGGRWRW